MGRTHIEAELKFPLDCREFSRVEVVLRGKGFVFVSSNVEEDYYLLHPCRDVVSSGEAIRVRRVNGIWESITYKGPPIESRVKAREEIIVGVSSGDPLVLMERLGFSVGIRVVKERKYYRSPSGEVVVTLDNVLGLGCFVEIEVSGVENAFERIWSIARDIGLGGEPVTVSYAEMLAMKKQNISK